MSKSITDLEEQFERNKHIDVAEIGLSALLFDMLLGKAKIYKGARKLFIWGKCLPGFENNQFKDPEVGILDSIHLAVPQI